MSVIDNILKPESVIKKENNPMSFAAMHSKSLQWTAHIDKNENPADMTKAMCSGYQNYLVNNILCNIYDDGFKPHTMVG